MEVEIWKNLPIDLIHIILKLDGKIKYKNGRYYDINLIDGSDTRYTIIRPIVNKKLDILRTSLEVSTECGFYFEFNFDNLRNVGLVYDFNFSFGDDIFEICYFDTRAGWIQCRTLLL